MDTLLKVKVVAKTLLAEGVAGFDLAPTTPTPLPTFDAGSHIDVHLPEGLIRQYSLFDLPSSASCYRIGVLREPESRGGSAKLVDEISVGDELSISKPRNHFALHDGEATSLLFAGGIGITPILCMAQQLGQNGQSFEMHYCGRTASRMAFVERLQAETFSDQVHLHVDDGDLAQQLNARAAIGAPASDKHLYVCGPGGFMAHILDTAKELGWDDEHLHREYFAADPIDHSGDAPFEIEVKSTGQIVKVAAEQSAAHALIDAGFDVSLSCEQGVCGTCMTKVLSGTPDHRDLYLTSDEHERNDCFMPCCSRAKTPRLLLDL